jgi:hypothetical protein
MRLCQDGRCNAFYELHKTLVKLKLKFPLRLIPSKDLTVSIRPELQMHELSYLSCIYRILLLEFLLQSCG